MKMRQHGCWAMGWLAAAAMTAGAPSLRAGEVRVWPRAEARSETLKLADLAELRGFDVTTAQNLAALEVGPAPRDGGEKLVYLNDIRAALQSRGANLAEITLVGASRCRVHRPRSPAPPPTAAPTKATQKKQVQKGHQASQVRAAARSVPTSAGATLETFLRDQIAMRLEESAGRLDIRFSPACKQDLALDDAAYQFELASREKVRPGLAALEVTITAPGKAARKAAIVAEISLLRQVVVARKGINRGESITAQHLKLDERRFTDPSMIGLTDAVAAIGRQPRELIRAGEMVLGKNLEDAPLVRRGDAVTIWVRRGGLTIKAAGRAQRAGKLGDRIEVSRDGARRKQDVIEAIVTGPGTVTLGDGHSLAATEGQE